VRGQEIFVGKTRGTLKTAAKFAKAFGAGRVTTFGVNAFELSGEFCCAAVVTRAEDEVEKFF